MSLFWVIAGDQLEPPSRQEAKMITYDLDPTEKLSDLKKVRAATWGGMDPDDAWVLILLRMLCDKVYLDQQNLSTHAYVWYCTT